MRNTLLSLAALALLPGCWVTQNQSATGEYARQVMVAQQRSYTVEQKLVETDKRLAQLEESLRAAGQYEAERLENIGQVNAEVNRLRGEIEVIRFELDELKRSSDAFMVDFDRRQLYDEVRLQQLEEFLGVDAPPPPSLPDELMEGDTGLVPEPCDSLTDPDCVPVEPGAVPEQAEPLPDDAAGKLARAMEHLEGGRTRVARVILEKAVQEHRDDPLMPEIRYRLAQTQFEENQWNGAVTAFQSVIDHHPKSDWSAWSILRQGDCFVGLGQPENAKIFYEEVVRVYPRSDAAKEARKLLR